MRIRRFQMAGIAVAAVDTPKDSTSIASLVGDNVDLATTPYRIEIDVATTTLRLYESGDLVLEAPAGVGTEEAPAAVGNVSHSDTISDYQQSGDAIAAIHGPLGAEDEIGATGAAVSHGCVRLHLDDLALLRDVPAGSPVDIIDSARDQGSDA